LIRVNGFSFRFAGNSTPALDGVNLSIDDGEFVTITGPSGSGKSTLCLCMCGFLPREGDKIEGNMLINGRDARKESVYDLAQEIGIVQQDPEAQLCTLNVSDEVAFGPENCLMSRSDVLDTVNWALDVVGASHLKNRETSNLSGGEKQRVAIASILAMRPRMMIFDEPTSQLDPKCTTQIFSIIADLQRKTRMTVIVVEHRLRQILPLSSRVVVMDKGQILLDVPSDRLKDHVAMLGEVGVRLPFVNLPKSTRLLRTTRETMLEVNELGVRFHGNHSVLDGVTFNVKRGERIGLMGDNGSGKTTLLLSLLGLAKPNVGKIILNGADVSKISFKERAKQIGLIFQNPNNQIFESSVLKEVLFACENFGMDENDSELKAMDILRACNLIQYRDRHPYGLSFGEKRRLNLASVFIYRPSLLLMDEPFIGQDFKNIKQLMTLANGFVEEGGSALMVIHDPDIAEMYCDRLIFLKEGKILVDENTETAFEKLRTIGEEEYTPGMGV
jgi:energy-coupling factor transport system ATP-binding protein